MYRLATPGEELDLVDVPPGRLVWFVRWEDLLCLELKWSSDDPNADRLIVHRKGRPGVHAWWPATSLRAHACEGVCRRGRVSEGGAQTRVGA